MNTLEQEIQKEIDLLMRELIEAYDKKGMRASGNWANSLRSEVSGTVGRIYGENYTEQLEYGRRAGGFPPIDQIEEWVRDKGIQAIEASITARNLAFLIARKIAREGWKRDRFGGVELVSEVLTPARIQQALDNIGFTAAQELVIILQKEIVDTLNV